MKKTEQLFQNVVKLLMENKGVDQENKQSAIDLAHALLERIRIDIGLLL